MILAEVDSLPLPSRPLLRYIWMLCEHLRQPVMVLCSNVPAYFALDSVISNYWDVLWFSALFFEQWHDDSVLEILWRCLSPGSAF
jgi:hypothetical protein